ncbi:hypothetical protein NDU88_002606 [Pleurodeles waltl]|uniref:Uncharacterized protein n=1 Tax=Pleurodeles waltl TaxID=8319 RepID=A0AAV7QC84_PLEWA|nr:hypothetical protein NDU88_002606 [Pleurodeles waltl]
MSTPQGGDLAQPGDLVFVQDRHPGEKFWRLFEVRHCSSYESELVLCRCLLCVRARPCPERTLNKSEERTYVLSLRLLQSRCGPKPGPTHPLGARFDFASTEEEEDDTSGPAKLTGAYGLELSSPGPS